MTDTDRMPDLPAFPFPSPSLTPPAEYAERRATCPFGEVRLPGPHYCLGSHLAKAELIIGLGTLLRRLPALRLTVTRDELTFSGGEIVDSMISLPVAW